MSETELRAMVRDVLREALAARKGGAPGGASAGPALNGVRGPLPSASPPTNGAAAPAVEPVAITSDADLAAFVRRLTALLDDPATGAAVRAGRHRFTLAGNRTAPAPHVIAPAPAAAASVVLSGTVTEAKIAANARAGTIVLAPGAVVTPLARDKARALGLKLEARR
jgi:hypothetical protein